MDLIAHFSRLFAYDAWANQEVAHQLARRKHSATQALKLMAHIFAAQRLWMERLRTQAADPSGVA